MNRPQSFSRYLSNNRTLFSHSARTARRKRIVLCALIGATALLAAAWQPAKAADEMVIRTTGPISYVCGGIAEVIIGKQRNGPTGTVKLAFLKPLTKFESLASGYGSDDF